MSEGSIAENDGYFTWKRCFKYPANVSFINIKDAVIFINEDGYFNTCTRGGGFINSNLPPRLVYTSYQAIFGDLADLVKIFQDHQKFFHNSA